MSNVTNPKPLSAVKDEAGREWRFVKVQIDSTGCTTLIYDVLREWIWQAPASKALLQRFRGDTWPAKRFFLAYLDDRGKINITDEITEAEYAATEV